MVGKFLSCRMVTTMVLKGEIIRAANYLAKIDEKNFSLEASTTKMLISLFSRKDAWQEHIKLFPAKYQFIVGATHI